MSWEIGLSQDFDTWFRDLDDDDQEAIVAAVDRLKDVDDVDSATFVGRVKGTRRRYLRELHTNGDGLAVPFTFDAKARNIILLAGVDGKARRGRD
jgi:hypothetical protein